MKTGKHNEGGNHFRAVTIFFKEALKNIGKKNPKQNQNKTNQNKKYELFFVQPIKYKGKNHVK